jgi:hypothetical protein
MGGVGKSMEVALLLTFVPLVVLDTASEAFEFDCDGDLNGGTTAAE